MIVTPRLAAALVLVGIGACEAVTDRGPFEGIDLSTPRLFAPGIVSTGSREYGITFTPDLREAYFTRRPPRGRPEIFVTRFEASGWTTPAPASFSYGDAESPALAPDGGRILFSSRRPLPISGDRSENIWEALRAGEGWSEPRPLAGDVNEGEWEDGEYERGHEAGPAPLQDGVLLYSTGTHPDWGEDIYVVQADAHGAFVEPRPLLLNSYGDDSHPAVSADGRYLVFQSYGRSAGIGEQDLWVAERTDVGWSDPMLLPEPINSPRSDGYPSFSPDGRLLFFASDRDARNGFYSIYHVGVDALGLERGR